MTKYKINDKKIELDTNKTYLDFFWESDQGKLVEINLEGMLGAVESGEIPVDYHSPHRILAWSEA